MTAHQRPLLWFPLLILSLNLALVTGCKTPPIQTWDQWQTEPVPPEPGLVKSGQGLPALAETPTVEPSYASGYSPGEAAKTGVGFDLAMRHPDFPETHIREIHIDITDGRAHTRLVWAGAPTHTPTRDPLGQPIPLPTGPWPVTAGRGVPGTDCNDPKTSNTTDTLCTPKGTFVVAGFADRLNSVPTCHYATWVVHKPRYIAIHSHTRLPRHPDSGGCIRMAYPVAKLVHNNSIAGVTRVHIVGRWKPHDPMFIREDARTEAFAAVDAGQ